MATRVNSNGVNVLRSLSRQEAAWNFGNSRRAETRGDFRCTQNRASFPQQVLSRCSVIRLSDFCLSSGLAIA